MRFGSKRGAALAIVIVVSAALLILAAALVSVAKFDLDYAQNSLESRQAYLDAKSAIEYGKAYVTKNPAVGDFTVNGSSGSGFTIGAAGDIVATYDSGRKLLNATGKYKSSERFRKLGYQFATAGSTALAPVYIEASGIRHGGTAIFNSDYTLNNGGVYVPILAKYTVKLTSGLNDFSAPQMYFMGQDSNNGCFQITGNGYINLKSDFFYFNGDITAKNYDPKHNYLLLYKYSNDNNVGNKVGFVYFNNVRIITGSTIKVLDGYYKFKDGLNLLDINSSYLTKLSSEADVINELKGQPLTGEKIVANKQYIEQNYTMIISGENEDSDGAHWVGSGSLTNGTPSNVPNNIVFLYITNCDNWGNKLDGTYTAKEIHLQYVNNSNLVVPVSKTVVFQADSISLNTQISDTQIGTLGIGGTKPMLTFDVSQTQNWASFILRSTDGTKDFYLTCPNKLTVYYSDPKNPELNKKVYKQSYDILPGIYHISTGIGISGVGVNLFTKNAQDYFASTSPVSTSSGDGTGSSGGATTTGGTYTDG
jgi:hypothetical protein